MNKLARVFWVLFVCFYFKIMFVYMQIILQTHFVSCDLSLAFPVCLQSVFQYAVLVCTFPSLLTINFVVNKVE